MMKRFGSSSGNTIFNSDEIPIITPPLPLLRFSANHEEQRTSTQTISGEQIFSYPNDLAVHRASRFDKLHNPIKARKLAKWFTMRSQREVNHRHMEAYNKTLSELNLDMQALGSQSSVKLQECCVYESFMYSEIREAREEKRKLLFEQEQIFLQQINQTSLLSSRNSPVNISSNNSSTNNLAALKSPAKAAGSAKDEDDTFADVALPGNGRGQLLTPVPAGTLAHGPSLRFDAEFESGNLEKSVRVVGRESLMNERDNITCEARTQPVQQEYDLTLRNDLNTEGNIQWFYFSVLVSDIHCPAPFSEEEGLSVRFNIVNMQKKDSLYNYGMKPAFLYQSQQITHQQSDWGHGGFDVCYFKNGSSSFRAGKGKRKSQTKSQYTLSYSFVFTHPGRYFFAYCFPYTYSDLQRQLNLWERDESFSRCFHRRVFCTTLAGNRCEVLTITDRASGPALSRAKPAVVITARVHPGESLSSFMAHGLIEFLCSDSPEAQKLRQSFIFTIVPMLNPDGVIHGNYRCSLAGTDLNRRFSDAHPSCHPTVCALKSLLKTISANRPILLYLDLHGHSKRKNCFLYGCDPILQPEKQVKQVEAHLSKEQIALQRVFCRLYPKILCAVSRAGNGGYFSFRDCNFRLDRSKYGTGRAVCWRELGIVACYTVEASFCGIGDNDDARLLRKHESTMRKQSSANAATLQSLTAAFAGESENSTDNDKDNFNTNNGSSNSAGFTANTNSGLAEFSFLQERYLTAVHFTKKDFLSMGRHLALALHHFANLTHADLEREADLLQQKDRDQRERNQLSAQRKKILQTQLDTPPCFRRSVAGSSATSNSVTSRFLGSGSKRSMSGRLRQMTQLLGQDNDLESDLIERDLSLGSTEDMCEDEEVESRTLPSTPTIPSTPALSERYYLDSTGEGDDADKEAEEEEEEDEDNDEAELGAMDTAGNAAVQLPVFLQSRIELWESHWLNRACLRTSLFSPFALQQLMRLHPTEVGVEKSTRNLGLRIKCELSIRRALHIEDKFLQLSEVVLPALEKRDFEEKNESDSGSDSCPSVDNRQAAQQLKRLSSGQTTRPGDMIASLRNAMLKARLKEAQRRRKAAVAAQKRLAQQVLQAKRLAAEKRQQELLQQQQLQELAARPPSARISSSAETKTIVLPRFSPAYRLDTKAQVVPVQIKIVNFRPTLDRRPQSSRDRSAQMRSGSTSVAAISGDESANPNSHFNSNSVVGNCTYSNSTGGSRVYRLARPSSAQPAASANSLFANHALNSNNDSSNHFASGNMSNVKQPRSSYSFYG